MNCLSLQYKTRCSQWENKWPYFPYNETGWTCSRHELCLKTLGDQLHVRYSQSNPSALFCWVPGYWLSRWGRYMKSTSVMLGIASMACLVDCVGCRGLELCSLPPNGGWVVLCKALKHLWVVQLRKQGRCGWWNRFTESSSVLFISGNGIW